MIGKPGFGPGDLVVPRTTGTPCFSELTVYAFHEKATLPVTAVLLVVAFANDSSAFYFIGSGTHGWTFTSFVDKL